MGDRNRSGGWREVLLVLACLCLVLQPGLLPLHLVLHGDGAVATDAHGTIHQVSGLVHFHCADDASVHEHDASRLADDQEPHPAEDHLSQPELVGARRSSCDLDFVAIAPPARDALPAEEPARAVAPAAISAPRPPPPRGAHRARAPPSAV